MLSLNVYQYKNGDDSDDLPHEKGKDSLTELPPGVVTVMTTQEFEKRKIPFVKQKTLEVKNSCH